MKRTANPGPAASPASAKQLDRDPDSVSLASASSISSVSSGGSGMGSLAFLNIRKRMGSTKSTASASSATSGGSYGAVSSNSNGALKSLFVKQAGLTVSTNQAGSASPSRKYAGSVNNTGSGTGTPTVIAMRAASFAEFRMADTRQQRQRRCLYALQKLETRFRVEGVSVGVSSTLAPGVARKPYREPKFKDDKRLGLGKLSNLLQKKRRKKSRTGS
ncbi:hypothetical protein BC830DRAFT_1146097 [Chytriomyces sp. MP71]|nr:hypothetical protein BC830DRAFT_1146097 [Chytriomyces sp. MP71]